MAAGIENTHETGALFAQTLIRHGPAGAKAIFAGMAEELEKLAAHTDEKGRPVDGLATSDNPHYQLHRLCHQLAVWGVSFVHESQDKGKFPV